MFYSLLQKKKKTRRISTCDQLRALKEEKVIKQQIKLVADIDCENVPFTPLKILFTKFDGNGHTIKNLNLRYSGKKKNIHQIGLFKSLASGAIVRNVTFLNVQVRGIRNVGVVAGNSHMAVVEHVTIDSDTEHGNRVIGRSNKVGSIIGYAKDSTLTSITVKRTLVRGINKVGGLVGLFTGGSLVNAANLGFRNSSSSIVQGIRSVGGIVGESSASNYLKVGVRRGVIFGEGSVGGITGKVFDAERADQLYTLKNVRIIFRSSTGSEFGGLFGSYVIEGDSNYTISNSYTRARIIGRERVGGIIGHLNIDTPDTTVTLSNLIVNSPIKDGPHNGKIIGVLDYNSNTQSFVMNNVLYFNGINAYLQEIGLINDGPNTHSEEPLDVDPTETKKRRSQIGAVGLDYVNLVESAIANFDQDHIWCQDRLRCEQGFNARHQICRCGPYSQDYSGVCLCSSFTELSKNTSFCINSTGICTTPYKYGKNFVPASENIYLEISASDVHFVESGPLKGNLEVHLSYTAQTTGWTDIVVLGKRGVFIASLSNFLLGKGYANERWEQSIDKSGQECMQQSSFSIPWEKVSELSQVEAQSGDFLLRVYAHTNLIREEKSVILRDMEGQGAEIITAVPIFISLNTSVTTEATLSAKFSLDFKIDCSYYVKSSVIDPTGLTMTVVIAHTVTNPLSLDVNVVQVLVDGSLTTGKVIKTEGVNCPPTFNVDDQTQFCEQETTVVIDLPLGNNCQDKIINLNITFDASCNGPNKVDSTICASVYEQVRAKATTSVPTTISFDFDFCPKIEDTSLTTSAFTISQKGKYIVNEGSIVSNHALNGTITLDVLQSVIDSSFESATIESVFLYEKVPSPETVEFLDVTLDCLREEGFEVKKDQIQISFSYIPNIYMLTKLLKNWYTGLYFVVKIDVNYAPTGTLKRSMMNAQVRLELPVEEQNNLSSEKTKSKSSTFKIIESKNSEKRTGTKVSIKDFTLEKAKKISEQYQKETKKGEVLMIVLGSSFGITMFIVLVTLVVVFYNNSKSKSQIVIQH